MKYRTSAHIGQDGTVFFTAPPDFLNSDVQITLEKQGLPTKVQEMSWEDFLKTFAGSVPDFPDVERSGPDSFEEREELP